MTDAEEKFRIINFKVYEKKITDLWNFLKDGSCEIILIKGWAAAQNYPQPYLRDIGDIDIAVNPEQYRETSELMKNYSGAVDLHEGLRHLDLNDWKTLYKNSRPVKLGEIEIRIPKYEDGLRIMIVHWLTDGGVNKRKLWDIYYAIENRPADFDWDYFLDGNGKIRRKWFVYTIGLVNKYLGLDLESTPIAEEAEKIPAWITKTVEKEWSSDVKFSYLETNLNSGKEFFAQLKKRIPPNPIQSTVNMEGDFDSRTRIFYQIGDMFSRLPGSIKRVSEGLLDRVKHSK